MIKAILDNDIGGDITLVRADTGRFLAIVEDFERLEAAVAAGFTSMVILPVTHQNSTLAVIALQFLLYGCLVRACGLELHPLQLVVGAAAAQVAGALPVVSVGTAS